MSFHQQTSLQGNTASLCRNPWACISTLLRYKIRDFKYPLIQALPAHTIGRLLPGMLTKIRDLKKCLDIQNPIKKKNQLPRKNKNKSIKYKFLQEDSKPLSPSVHYLHYYVVNGIFPKTKLCLLPTSAMTTFFTPHTYLFRTVFSDWQ